MKRVQPDIGQLLLSSHMQTRKFVNEFSRDWGKKYVNGVEVFQRRNTVYPMSANMEAMTKRTFKNYRAIKDLDTKNIKKYFLYLNPSNEIPSDSLDSSFVEGNIARRFNTGDRDGAELTFSIVPKGKSGRLDFNNMDSSGRILNKIGLMAEIKNNFERIWTNYGVNSHHNDNSNKNLLAKYILRSLEVPSTVIDVQRRVTSVTETLVLPSLLVTVKVPDYIFTSDTDIVGQVAATVTQNPNNLSNYNDKATSLFLRGAGGEDDVNSNTDNLPIFPVTSGAWLVVPDTPENKHYLKTSFIDDSNIRMEDKLQTITTALSLEYEREPRDFWESFIAAVIILGVVVGAVVLSPVTGGSSLKVAATALMYISLAVSVLSLAATEMGYLDAAYTFNAFNQGIAPLVTVASYVLLYETLASPTSTLGAKALAATTPTAQVLANLDVITDEEALYITAASSVTTLATNYESISKLAFSSKLGNTVLGLKQGLNLAELRKYTDSHNRRMSNVSELEEQMVVDNPIMKSILLTPIDLKADWSMYAGTYDRPYEPWSTPYHAGNTQANTVNAFWFSKD